jgi:hypothetical protein
MMDQPTFRILDQVDEDYRLAPTTLANKRALCELQVRARIIPRANRLDIAASMGWQPERVVDELAEPEYYAAVARVLFPGAPIDEHLDHLDQGTVAQAARVFTQRSFGMR